MLLKFKSLYYLYHATVGNFRQVPIILPFETIIPLKKQKCLTNDFTVQGIILCTIQNYMLPIG